MLTFLRKIRKSLIESGSARKYLLYAIGEIRTPEVVKNLVLSSQSVQAAIKNQTGMAEVQIHGCSDIINYINTFKQEILTSYQGAQKD